MSAYRKLRPILRLFVDGLVAGEMGTHAVRRLRPMVKRPDVLAAKWRARSDVREAVEERQAYAAGLEKRVAKLESEVTRLCALVQRAGVETQ